MAIVFALWTLLGAAAKIPFLALYLPPTSWAAAGDWLSVLWHGLLLDAAIGGYLTLLPGMMMAIAPWYRGRMMRWVWDIYFAEGLCDDRQYLVFRAILARHIH